MLELQVKPISDVDLYQTDFYAWTQLQAKLLEQQIWHELDISNLIEEIAGLGKQQQQELRNRLGILVGHLLKWDYQPQKRSKSWKATIREQRHQVQLNLQENPILKSYLLTAVDDSYELALALVVRETPLDYQDLPSLCPYQIAEILDPKFPMGIDQ
jgi:hypothetical protein